MIVFLEKLPFIGPVIRNIKIILICAAIVLATNVISGFWWHHVGYSSAMVKCDRNTLIRERDEARRDLSIQKDTATFYKSETDRLSANEIARRFAGGEYAANFKTDPNCVVPLKPPRRVR